MSLQLQVLRGILRLIAKPLFAATQQAGPARLGLVLSSLGLPLPSGVWVRRSTDHHDWLKGTSIFDHFCWQVALAAA